MFTVQLSLNQDYCISPFFCNLLSLHFQYLFNCLPNCFFKVSIFQVFCMAIKNLIFQKIFLKKTYILLIMILIKFFFMLSEYIANIIKIVIIYFHRYPARLNCLFFVRKIAIFMHTVDFHCKYMNFILWYKSSRNVLKIISFLEHSLHGATSLRN